MPSLGYSRTAVTGSPRYAVRETCHLSGLDPLHSSLSSPLRVKIYNRLLTFPRVAFFWASEPGGTAGFSPR